MMIYLRLKPVPLGMGSLQRVLHYVNTLSVGIDHLNALPADGFSDNLRYFRYSRAQTETRKLSQSLKRGDGVTLLQISEYTLCLTR